MFEFSLNEFKKWVHACMPFRLSAIPVGALFVFAVCFMGCQSSEYTDSKWIPARVIDDPPYEVDGLAIWAWGDGFKMLRIRDGVHELHQGILIGIDTPKTGQPYQRRARRASLKLFRGKEMNFKVVSRNGYQFECGFLFDGEKDLGLEMIKLGMAWYDGDDFERADEYRAAELEAREAKLGLWADDDPVPPWEYFNEQQQAFIEELQGDEKSMPQAADSR